MSAQQAQKRGLTSTMTFPVGNIAPEGSVIKSTAIDPSVINEEGIYYHQGVAKVYLSEKTAIYDIKHDKIKAGDLLLEFDRQAILDAGYDLATPIIISNSDDYRALDIVSASAVDAGQPLLSVSR